MPIALAAPVAVLNPSPPGSAGAWVGPDEIDAAVRQLGEWGVTRGGGARVLSSLLDPALDIDALARQIGVEPGLALRVLRVANSPYYGHAGQVATLQRAAQVLGLQALRGITAAACFSGLTGATRTGGPDLKALRRHSLATACAAQAVARRIAPDLVDQAFMAGLLHDVGLLVQWRLRPQAMAAWSLQGSAAAGPTPGPPAEQAAIGVTHAFCGQRLLASWQMPAALCEAIARHDSGIAALPGDGSPPELGLVLALGEALTHGTGHSVPGDNPPTALLLEAALETACAEAAAAWPAALQALAAVFGD